VHFYLCPSIENRQDPRREILSHRPGLRWKRRSEVVGTVISRLPAIVANTTHFYLSSSIENRQDPRREILSHRPGLRWKRRNEVVGTDTFFPNVKTAQGHICSQLFVGQNSLRWDVFPLKTEANNYQALQDVSRNQGAANVIRSDNATSETDNDWTNFCRQHCVSQQTTLPHAMWMNFAERNIGSLGAMVCNCHRAFKNPIPISQLDAKVVLRLSQHRIE
jgi:hypothetical protein